MTSCPICGQYHPENFDGDCRDDMKRKAHSLRTFYLRDYLAPGGNHPYSQLATDLEECRKAGYEVRLKSVPGFLIAFGTPDNKYRGIFAKYPWNDTDGRYYRTAEECIARRNGTSNPKLQED